MNKKKSLLVMVFVSCFFVSCLYVNAKENSNRKFYCEKDSDCMNSCLLGAVSEKWYVTFFKDVECKDGCSAKNVDLPRCVQNACVSYDRNGKKIDECTKRKQVQ